MLCEHVLDHVKSNFILSNTLCVIKAWILNWSLPKPYYTANNIPSDWFKSVKSSKNLISDVKLVFLPTTCNYVNTCQIWQSKLFEISLNLWNLPDLPNIFTNLKRRLWMPLWSLIHVLGCLTSVIWPFTLTVALCLYCANVSHFQVG